VDISRRQLVALGGTGAVGALVGKVALSSAPAAADDRMHGIHISVLTKGISPDAIKDFPHHFTMTLYGPDNALTGMGWGGATDLKTQQDIINSQMLPCIYSLTGAAEGDVVKVHGLMLFSGNPDQGQPLLFEANLATGSLRCYAPFYQATLEGTGVVARI
jgi:hypothetical protein